MQRSVWNDSDIFDKPYAVDSSGNLYVHEEGYNNDASPMMSFIKTSEFDLDEGDQVMFADRVIPDAKIDRNLNYTFNYRKYPNETPKTKGPFAVTSTTRKFNPRIRS